MAQNKKITELVGAQPRSGFLFVVADSVNPTVENYKVDYHDISGQLGDKVCGDKYEIQFNSGGACGADPYLTYNYDDGYVAIGTGCDLFRASGCTVDIFGSLYVQGTGTGDCTACLPSGGLISGWTGIHDFFSGNTGHVRDEVIVGTGLNLLKASGDLVEISGDLSVSGDVRVTGGCIIAPCATFTESLTLPQGSDLHVPRNLYVGNDLTVSGDSTLEGSLEVIGGIIGMDLTILHSASLLGASELQEATIMTYLDVREDVTISGDLSVSGCIEADCGNFINSLTLSGNPVSTGDNIQGYPVVTGGAYDEGTSIISLFRDLGASAIEIDISSCCGGAATSTQWFEINFPYNDLIPRETPYDSFSPAIQLWEPYGPDAYTPSLPGQASPSTVVFFEPNGNGDLQPTLNP